MQYTPIGVIAIVALALASLALYNHHTQAERAHSAAYAQYDASKQDAPMGAVAQRRQTDPKSYREEWRSEYDLRAQRDMAEWAKWMLVATCFSSIVTIIGIVFVAQTLGLNRLQLEQSRIANTNLLASDRPWMQVGFETESPLTFSFDENGRTSARIRIKVRLTNCGKSPALNVMSYLELAPVSINVGTNIKEHIERKGASVFLALRDGIEVGDVIFPGAPHVEVNDIEITPEEISKVEDLFKFLRLPDLLYPTIIGCVRYTDGRTGHGHETGFAFHVRDRRREDFAIDPHGGQVPPAEIEILSSIAGHYMT